MVSGTELYNVSIEIKKLAPQKWKDIKKRCAGQIGSLLELLQGRLSKSVMTVVADRDNGLFPHPKEISLHCSCPDWAVMCKHVAAVLYGVGVRLDEKPELLFLLRGVDHEELINAEAGFAAVSNASLPDAHQRIAESDLSHLFGIDITPGEAAPNPKPAPKRLSSVGKKGKSPAKAPAPKAKSEPIGRKEKPPKAADKSRKTKAQDRPVTSKAVVKLRKKLNMTKAGFAKLLGVSPATIGNWEKSKGPLNLRASTRRAWNSVSKIKKKEGFLA